MTANSTLEHILIPRVRFLMSAFKMEIFTVTVWQVAAKVSFSQCNITLQVLYPQVEGANNTSSGFLFLHIDKSLGMCKILFSPTSIIHVEITDSSLMASKFFQHFRESIVTLSINRSTLYHSCSIAFLKNVCYIKITESTFIYTQHGIVRRA